LQNLAKSFYIKYIIHPVVFIIRSEAIEPVRKRTKYAAQHVWKKKL